MDIKHYTTWNEDLQRWECSCGCLATEVWALHCRPYNIEKKITMKDIRRALDYMEDNKPKCKKCHTAFDAYCGILGYNCKCGCERDAQTPQGRDSIAMLRRFFQ